MIGGASLYRPGKGWLYRVPAALKLSALAVAGSLALFTDGPFVPLTMLVFAFALYPVAGFGWQEAWRQLRPLLWIFAFLFVAQGWLVGWDAALTAVARFAALVLLAALVTLTTPTAAMMAIVERILRPLQFLGVDPARVSLALSLAIRFLPVIETALLELREARRARGASLGTASLAVPLIVRILRSSDEIADAIDARS